MVTNESILNVIIENELNKLDASEKMKEYLELRLRFIHSNKAKKTDYEKNEDKILEMRTILQINKMRDIIDERRHDLSECFNRYFEELEFNEKHPLESN
jgi:hypothetical protein